MKLRSDLTKDHTGLNVHMLCLFNPVLGKHRPHWESERPTSRMQVGNLWYLLPVLLHFSDGGVSGRARFNHLGQHLHGASSASRVHRVYIRDVYLRGKSMQPWTRPSSNMPTRRSGNSCCRQPSSKTMSCRNRGDVKNSQGRILGAPPLLRRRRWRC